MAKKLLIIEDAVSLCEILGRFLKENGFDVIAAYDGEQGLSMARQEKPDLIILDLGLPKMPGEEVCREVRKDSSVCSIPIIMLTAKDDEVDMILGKVIGANAYYTKPFNSDRLLREIKALLKI